jgi:arylsulfatase A-like enzyme
LLVLALGPLACGPGAPRNVVLITLDTTRADALGAYGQRRPTSPRIDAMAADGVLFEQAVSSAPSTLPSHATLLTGKQPYAHGARSNAGFRLAAGNLTLAEVLQERGWVTQAEVAAPVLGRATQLGQGFGRYRDPRATESVVDFLEVRKTRWRHTRPAEEITERGLEFVRENAERPFLLWLHYFDAHEPHDPPERFGKGLALYHGEIRRIDHHVGLLLDEVERLGLRDDTVVVLTADHGEGHGQHGEDTHSFFVYDSTIRVPLVFWGTRAIPRGQRVASLVRLVDVAPTLLDLLGLPPLEAVQGTSLVSLFDDPGGDLRVTSYGESLEPTLAFGSSVLRFVREGRWKYIHKLEPELYDLASDPRELDNLASKRPERVEQLRGRLEALVAEAPPPPEDARRTMDEEAVAQLRALGYVVGSTPLVLDDERASLVVAGPDPTTRIGDLREYVKAWGLIGSRDFDLALEKLRKLEERNPESPAVVAAQSEALRRAERDDEIIPVLRRGLELEPDSIRYRLLLAKTLRSRGEEQAAEAEQLLRQALALDPCDATVRLHLSEVLRAAGRYPEQLALLEEGSDACPDSVVVRNALAFALATSPVPELRDGPRAVRMAEAAVAETDARHPGYLDTLAAAHAETGDFERALAEQRRAFALFQGRNVEPGLLEGYERHLADLEAGRPIREP